MFQKSVTVQCDFARHDELHGHRPITVPVWNLRIPDGMVISLEQVASMEREQLCVALWRSGWWVRGYMWESDPTFDACQHVCPTCYAAQHGHAVRSFS